MPFAAARFSIFLSPTLALLFLVAGQTPSLASQAEALPVDSEGDSPSEDDAHSDGDALDETAGDGLKFSFGNTRWRDVIDWLAREGDLALHVAEIPTGSFTFTDNATYTLDEAIARVNLFLLPQGYTLVRSGRILSVINLADPRGLQQLDSLARVVTLEQLDALESHEVVKCFFALNQIQAEDAVEELAALNLMKPPSVFSRTNRLLITDSVGKLRNVKVILDAFDDSSALGNGTVVKNFALQHADAEDILAVARPHLGLATGEMIGIDVSLSADPLGKNIFVTGVADKVELIENLINSLDVASDSLSTSDGSAELIAHAIPGGNVEIVYNVLITLLAGETVRLSMDETAGTIVALASPEIQQEIRDTISELEASQEEFAMIPLQSAVPFMVVSLLEEMFDIPDPLFDDPEDEGYNHDAPKIDADPDNMRLFVRAKPEELAKIKEIIADLDEDVSSGTNRDPIRLLPIRGPQIEEALQVVARLWRRDNLIILYPIPQSASRRPIERVVADETSDLPSASDPTELDSTSGHDEVGRVLAGDIRSATASIYCQPTERGLLVQSEDLEALDELVYQLQLIAEPTRVSAMPPVVYYLKYAQPEAAIRMLAELLDGEEDAMEGGSGSLVRGFVSSGGSLLGSLVSTSQGTLTMSSGTITVVADTRVNRLIAQGTREDLERIEGYLKIIDKDSSITTVETYGRARVIELKNSDARVVAEVLREAFAHRLFVANQGNPGGGQGDPRQRDQRAEQNQDRNRQQGDERRRDRDGQQDEGQGQGRNSRPSGQGVQDLEPRMTIAVHEQSNSLIVTAQEQLFREVEQLAKLIDQRNEQIVDVISIEDRAVIDSLIELFGEGTATGSGIEFSVGPGSDAFRRTQNSPTPRGNNQIPTIRDRRQR